MKTRNIVAVLILLMVTACQAQPKVYFTKEITPEALVKIYKALGKEAQGRVAVKISTGEAGGHNYLSPELIRDLVSEVNGTIVECNTAYGGSRASFKKHWETIHDHGFDTIATVVLMDENGDMEIPIQDMTHLEYDIVGKDLQNYDFMVNLAHFKGHEMGGFGGVLKNQSIGVASASGKGYIHSAGYTDDPKECWRHRAKQDDFLESMAAAAQAVHEYLKGNVVYINVMNNMSIDCDCNGHPAKPLLKDMGIVASLDPVAADQAALDMVFSHESVDGDDAAPLIERINKLHGTYITEYAEQIGLGSRTYTLFSLDE